MAALKEHARRFGLAPICQALGVPRSSVYRLERRRKQKARQDVRKRPDLSLSAEERQEVLTVYAEYDVYVEFPGYTHYYHFEPYIQVTAEGN